MVSIGDFKTPFEVGYTPKRHGRVLTGTGQLSDPDLLKQQSFIDGEWVESSSGERFEIIGQPQHSSRTDCTKADTGLL